MAKSKLSKQDREKLRAAIHDRDYLTPEHFAVVQLAALLGERRESPEHARPGAPRGPYRRCCVINGGYLYLEVAFQDDRPVDPAQERAALGIWRRNLMPFDAPEWERLDTSSAVFVWKQPEKLVSFLGKWFREALCEEAS